MSDSSERLNRQVGEIENEVLLMRFCLMAVKEAQGVSIDRERYEQIEEEILNRMEEGGGESVNDDR